MNLRKQVYGSLGYLFYGDNCCVVAWFLISLIAPLISRFSAKLCRQNAFGFDIKSWSKVKQPKSQTAAQQSSRQDTSKCCSQRRLNKQQADRGTDNQTARQTKEAWKGVCLSWFVGATNSHSITWKQTRMLEAPSETRPPSQPQKPDQANRLMTVDNDDVVARLATVNTVASSQQPTLNPTQLTARPTIPSVARLAVISTLEFQYAPRWASDERKCRRW